MPEKDPTVLERPTGLKAKLNSITRFYVGDVSVLSSDDVRRVLIINLFASVGILFTCPLGIASFFQGKLLLGSVLIGVTFLYSANHIYLRRTHRHVVSGNFVIYPLYALMLYLIYTGGVNGTGHVWLYCVPAVALFLHGLKKGLIELAIFTLLLSILMFYTDNHFSEFGYHPSLKSRILFSFAVVVFLSGIYEFSMSRFNDELKTTSAKLKLVAYTDMLTNLLNRRGIYQKLEQRQQAHLLLADVDFFKRVNDEYGHDAGDYALEKIAQIMRAGLPKGALSSRWGGEEFLLAVFDCSHHEAYEIAESVRNLVADYEFNYLDQSFHVTLSFGIASMNDTVSLREAITLADSHLYNAKRAGRNQTRRD
ncbi:GGDEF domain-containing protein [Marinomonas posidonica]|uniref:diguanylate cyclase n=1 Tax=Marinomonas posidonica (strain CECT 7376 / NCIMB 14433 / IVIA-Po-181) TaxID=491952 RepID=F6D0E4_MARPP|nr:GGDEF domain-containing protein [Marinomonas posidonica]AEF53666.1 diguanylate cyclase [Marinomonas posidonica IVIA-Po-181]